MMRNGNIVIVGFLLVLLACVGMGYWATDQMARATNANAARIEQARAQQAEALAQQQEFAARQAEAEKEQRLYDSAAYAVETQADLVRWYAQRGDTRVQTAIEWLTGFAVAGFVVWLASREQKNSLPNPLPNVEGGLLEAPLRENTPPIV
jgi:predicted negative regulator of RcsB-dependent stress response